MRLLPVFVGAVQAINILMNNDDGFGSGNLRETYRLLKEKGHNVWIVAPATKQSGMGGKSDFTTEANLTGPSQYDLIPKGAPSLGSDPHDSHIWYYNGTPAACTFVALDAVLPKHGDFKVPDLMVTGPNYGTNLGPFVWTLSGTAGAAYAAVERSIPAVALSASNEALSYKEVTNTSNPATWAAQVSVHVIEQLINSAPKDSALLPLGYGLNVNIPPLQNASIPEIIQTRMNGGAHVNEAIEKDGVFTWRNLQPKAAGINACVSGDCNLPDETYVVEHGSVSISTFIVDYSAPENFYAKGIRKRLEPLTKKDHDH